MIAVVMLVLIVGVAVVIGLASVEREDRREKAAKEIFELTKKWYDAALDALEYEPDNLEYRQEALKAGREYYAYLNPDTYTSHRSHLGMGFEVGRSDFTDNTAAREAKVMADIQIRIAGRMKKAG